MGSEGVVADVADDKGDDSSQGVVADLPTDKEDVSQEVVADRDLSGVETADLANDKGDVSEGVVADMGDDKGDSLEGVQGVMHGLEGHKGNVCPHGGWDLSKEVMADPASDEEVVSQGVAWKEAKTGQSAPLVPLTDAHSGSPQRIEQADPDFGSPTQILGWRPKFWVGDQIHVSTLIIGSVFL